MDFVKSIEDAIEASSYAIGVFCDLTKAFDTLNHEILLKKLDHYGIRDKAQMWFGSYLANRYQYVELNGYKSAVLPLPTGVPLSKRVRPLRYLFNVTSYLGKL